MFAALKPLFFLKRRTVSYAYAENGLDKQPSRSKNHKRDEPCESGSGEANRFDINEWFVSLLQPSFWTHLEIVDLD